jgi:hypothetical protein
MRTADMNKTLIERFWDDLYRRDFEAVGAYFTPDGRYTDVFTPDEDVAVASASSPSRASSTTPGASWPTSRPS